MTQRHAGGDPVDNNGRADAAPGDTMSNGQSDPDSQRPYLDFMVSQGRFIAVIGCVMLADSMSRLLPHDWAIHHPYWGGGVTMAFMTFGLIVLYVGRGYEISGRFKRYLANRAMELLSIGLALVAAPSVVGFFTAWRMPMTSAAQWTIGISLLYLILGWLVLAVISAQNQEVRE
jgi:hypothetical protein